MHPAIRPLASIGLGLALLYGTVATAQTFSTQSAPVGSFGEKPTSNRGAACGTEILTRSTSQAITAANSVSCNAGGLHTDNSYFRAFSLASFPQGFDVCAVEFGVETAAGAGGTQPVTLRVFSNTGAAFPGGTRTLITEQAISLANQAATVFSQALAASLPAGTNELVFEVFTPNGQVAGHSFFIGSNGAGETGPSFLQATDCGVASPTATSAIGFPQMQIVMNILGDPGGQSLNLGAVTEMDVCASLPGNNNGIIEPGEVVDFTIPLNAQGGTFNNVVGTLSSGTAGVTVVTGIGTYGTIAGGASGSANYQIRVDNTVACDTAINLTLDVTSDEDNFSFPVDRNVGSTADIAYAGLPAPIPDNSPAGGSSTAIVSGLPGALTSVSVDVSINHTWVGDVSIELTSPGGTTVTLLDQPGVPATTFGCNNENINVLFADGQPNPEAICGPADTPWPVTTAGPVTPLSAFNGEDGNGTWTLTAFDSAGGDTGAIVGWELIVNPAPVGTCNACPSDPEFAFGVASLNFGNVVSGTTSAVQFITLSNNGDGPGTIDTLTITAPFAISGGTCGAVPIVLAAGASCTVGVVFNAGPIVNAVGQLTATGNGQTIIADLFGSSILQPPQFIPVDSPLALALMALLMTLLAGVFVYRRQS